MQTIATLVALAAALAAGQGPRNLLTGGLSEQALAAALLPAAHWHPYPTIRDRADWEAVPPEIRAGFIQTAGQYLGTTWERIPATVTLQFIRNGNRSNYDAINTRQREKLATLVLAEVFENEGRFLDEIADGIWAISEQTFWGSTAHLGMQRAGNGLPDVTEPIVDLFAAETGALLAWTDYLLGPRHWGRAWASLFDNLERLRSATNGTVDIYRSPLVRNMGQYIYRVYIKDEYFVPMGDAAAKITPDAELVYQYGKRIGDPVMQGFGALLAQRRGPYRPGASSPGRILPALLVAREIATANVSEPLPGSVWLADLQLMAARSVPNSAQGLYVAAWGGHNAQSHNHNDVGNFLGHGDGKPVLIDVGVETYSAKTFSPQRYEIWTMQSAYHNLPTINGIMQGAGREFQAKDVSFNETANRVTFSADIAAAYPAAAAVNRWQRRVSLDRRAPAVEVEDRYELTQWKEPVLLSLMTPLRVDITRPGEVHLRASQEQGGGRYVLAYDAHVLRVAAEDIAISDAQLRSCGATVSGDWCSPRREPLSRVATEWWS